MSNPGGTLPNGKHTASDRVYVREWRKAGKAVADVLNRAAPSDKRTWCMTSFDPTMSLCNAAGQHVQLDRIVFLAIIKLDSEHKVLFDHCTQGHG